MIYDFPTCLAPSIRRIGESSDWKYLTICDSIFLLSMAFIYVMGMSIYTLFHEKPWYKNTLFHIKWKGNITLFHKKPWYKNTLFLKDRKLEV